MDDGRLRGDGRLGDDSTGGWGERDRGREDWKSFRERVDREWRPGTPGSTNRSPDPARSRPGRPTG